jgi:hypothetical protein
MLENRYVIQCVCLTAPGTKAKSKSTKLSRSKRSKQGRRKTKGAAFDRALLIVAFYWLEQDTVKGIIDVSNLFRTEEKGFLEKLLPRPEAFDIGDANSDLVKRLSASLRTYCFLEGSILINQIKMRVELARFARLFAKALGYF